MRQIKFKFWNHIVGRMTLKSFTLEELQKEPAVWTNIIPLQCTGLKDIKGNEVYELDVFREEIEYDEGDELVYYIVTWIKECAMFMLLGYGEYINYKDNGVDVLDFGFGNGMDNIKNHKSGVIGNYYKLKQRLQSVDRDLDELTDLMDDNFARRKIDPDLNNEAHDLIIVPSADKRVINVEINVTDKL